MRVANELLIHGALRIQLMARLQTDSSPRRRDAARAHPELLLEPRAAAGVGREDAVDVAVQLPGGNLGLSAEDGLRQSVVDENVLLLAGNRGH